MPGVFDKDDVFVLWEVQIVASRVLNSIVAGISVLSPVVSWLFPDIRNLGNGFHILQTKFYGQQQTERCSMIHGKGLTVEVGGEQRLWMTGSRQVD
jgi:hypothetical protein